MLKSVNQPRAVSMGATTPRYKQTAAAGAGAAGAAARFLTHQLYLGLASFTAAYSAPCEVMLATTTPLPLRQSCA